MKLLLTLLALLGTATAAPPTEEEHDRIVLKIQSWYDANKVDQTGTANEQTLPGLVARAAFNDCLDGTCNGCINTADFFLGDPGLGFLDSLLGFAPPSPPNLLADINTDIGYTITRSDLLQLTANVGFLMAATNPEQPATPKLMEMVTEFDYGRKDGVCTAVQDPDGIIAATACIGPVAPWVTCSRSIDLGFTDKGFGTDSAKAEVEKLVARLAISKDEFVAIMGMRVLQGVITKFVAPFVLPLNYVQLDEIRSRVPNRNVFDNSYFAAILGAENIKNNWEYKRSKTAIVGPLIPQSNNHIWELGGNRMESADMSLAYDIVQDSVTKIDADCKSVSMIGRKLMEFGRTDILKLNKATFATGTELCTKASTYNQVRLYSKNGERWMDDFSFAWRKVTTKKHVAADMKAVANNRNYDFIYPGGEISTVPQTQIVYACKKKSNNYASIFG